MSLDSISVVMPSYNSEAYINEAIDSLINQSYENWNLIAIDDGSSDNTGKILDEYSAKDKRIKVIHNNHSGVSKTRNLGLDNASGDYVILMDSDDIYEKEAFKTFIKAIEGFDIVVGNYDRFSEEDHSGKIKSTVTEERQYLSIEQLRADYVELYQKGLFHSACNTLIRRDLINVRFREEYCIFEDGLFMLELLKSNKRVKIIPDITYHYRDNITGSLSKSWIKYRPEMNNLLEQILSDSSMGEEIKDLYYDIHIGYSISSIGAIYDSLELSLEDKHKRIKEILECANIKMITNRAHAINNKNMHLWSILLTKDMDLIDEAFDYYLKQKKAEKS